MSVRKLVDGFNYLTGKPIALSPAEWRQKYPPTTHRRLVVDGETWYYLRAHGPRGHRATGLEAEAYAVIPATRSDQ